MPSRALAEPSVAQDRSPVDRTSSGMATRVPAAHVARTRQYLLVVDQQVAPDAQLRRVLNLVDPGAAHCHVVIPASPTATHPWTWDEDEARCVAADRLVRLLAGLRRLGVEASGEVGDADIVESVSDALRGRRVDEIVLALSSRPLARRIGRDPVGRIRRTCGVPVTHVVVPVGGRPDRHPHSRETVAGGLAGVEDRLAALAQRHGVVMLRAALGVIFVWFGVLKVIGASPVGELVARTLFVLPARPALIALGLIEVGIGISLLTGRAVRVALAVFMVQMFGTFLTLVLVPDVAFQHGNPLLLSTVGEFVMKNLVLITAGIAIVGTLRRDPA
jgi:putative oxidoreductase